MLFQEPNKKVTVWTPVDCEPAAIFGQETVQTSSEAQREIFSASLTDSDASRSYNHSISIFLEGQLDIDALYSCLLNLLDRHEALRGCFSADGEQFIVRERIAFSMPVLDLSGRSEEDQKAEYDAFIRRELDHVFDLVRGPLFRATLLRHSSTKWTMVFNCHHAVVDGWSLKIILDDLPKLYSALVKGKEEADLEPASSFVEYLDTAVAREKEMAESVNKFWHKTFEDGMPLLDLPLDKSRPMYRAYNSRREDYKIDKKIYEKIKEVGARNGTSQFVTLLSTFSLYLYRISGQDDHVIGVPAAGQIKSGKAKLLGHDARLMPIRNLIKPEDTFKTFSKRVMERFFSAYDNQWVSLPGLIKELKIPVDPSRVPFISVMFNFDPGMDHEAFNFEGLKASHYFNHRNYESFEISINAVIEHAELVLECAYNTSLFDPAEMHERLMQLEQLMASIGENPDMPVSQLRILTEKQATEMDRALNSTEMNFERELCVDQLIERVVQARTANVAVEFKDAQLSYAQMWELSGKVANTVLAAGLGPNPLVGVMLERTENLVPVLLGIWRAGGAFVPLDPSYPLDRLQYMVEHSAIRMILTQESLNGSLELPNLNYVNISGILTSDTPTDVAPVAGKNSEDLAYVIYTSGSTGKPKGVKVPQRALNNFLMTMKNDAPGMSSDDRVLAVTTLSFDIAELELWLPLVTGARVVIVDRATAIDGIALMKTVTEKKINFMQATPATWRLLIFSGWEGDPKITGLCGGEALPRELADDILKRVGTLWNVYGPTETTVWSTIDRVRQGPITIGRPIGNTQLYVLDAQNNWVPRGVVGELWIGGDGVTKGYLNRDDLTQERFIPNKFTGQGHIYKTGDLVRLRQDGRVEYIGRNDFQVKVRGFRIELGEVQHALSKHPALQTCVVTVKEKSPGDAHLVAYYTFKPGHTAKPADLKVAMKESVPEYMVPTYFMELAEMPLTNNGKINVKALPSPFEQGAGHDEDFVPPRTETEIYLARLWSELLGVSRIGRTDRFLELGGHSLLAIRAIQRIQKERNLRVTPKALILKNLEQLAAEISGEAAPQEAAQARPARDTSGELPMFFGSEKAQKFGYYHAGRETADFAVLICPPLGQEYMRTHWLIRNICGALNRKGLPVMRFDFYGQGDSHGRPEAARLQDYCDSILEAAEELRKRSGLARVKIVAFRAAALIADKIADQVGPGTQLVLIDPVSSGRAYLAGLRRTQIERWGAYPYEKSWHSDASHEEILGQLYSRGLIRELESLELSARASTVTLMPTTVAGWDDFTRLEQIWLAPELQRDLGNVLSGASS